MMDPVKIIRHKPDGNEPMTSVEILLMEKEDGKS